jgi:HAMP domain-containing protein
VEGGLTAARAKETGLGFSFLAKLVFGRKTKPLVNVYNRLNNKKLYLAT